MLSVVVANAPISYGAFELTVGVDPSVPDGDEVMSHVAAAGYSGIDLGPPGYLGFGETLRARLLERGLGLAGGYLELPYSQPEQLSEAMPQLDALLDLFDPVRDLSPIPPRPTLADAGSEPRRKNPGRSATERRLGFDEAGWLRFADGLERVVERCRERGYEPTLHPETGTHIEAPWEIERALELTSIGLCLDSGHLVIGGGDPVQAVRDWGSRINHLHVKDVRRQVAASIVEERAPAFEIWRRRAFCRLGEGDVDIQSVLDGLASAGYSGWLVVEQDILPDPADAGGPTRDQEANRRYLAERGL